MSLEFTQQDYINSFKIQYKVNEAENQIAPGNRRFLDLADLNGRLLWNKFEPYEPAEWETLPKEIRNAPQTQRLELLKEHNLLRPLRLVEVHHKEFTPLSFYDKLYFRLTAALKKHHQLWSRALDLRYKSKSIILGWNHPEKSQRVPNSLPLGKERGFLNG